VVPGGGVALLRSQSVLDNLKVDEEQQFGVRIVHRALEEPMRWIARNAGQDGSVVVDKVRQSKGSVGYNAASEEYEDLMKAGIIDPTKVVRTALLNAASVAGLLLTTEAMVAEKPKEEKQPAGGGMPHGGEDY
jgi:chaperonin GroEL